jgi:hypothetical protein
MPATAELLSRYRPIRKYSKSSSNEILFPKNEKNSKHTRGRSPRRKCSPYLLDGNATSNAPSDTIDKQSPGKIFDGRRDRSDNSTKLEGPSMESLIKEVDGQEISNGEYEEYLQEGGGDEPEELIPPPGPDVHPFVGKQGATYVYESIPGRNGEIIRDIFYNFKSEDQTRGMLFLMRFARAWGRQKTEIELVLKQWAKTTLKNYIYAWNTFFDFLSEHDDWLDCFNSPQQLKSLYINYVIWLMELDSSGKPRNASKGSFRLCKSGVATVLNTITDVDVANDKWNKAITMNFLRENPVKPKRWYMWPISDLFKYIK